MKFFDLPWEYFKFALAFKLKMSQSRIGCWSAATVASSPHVAAIHCKIYNRRIGTSREPRHPNENRMAWVRHIMRAVTCAPPNCLFHPPYSKTSQSIAHACDILNERISAIFDLVYFHMSTFVADDLPLIGFWINHLVLHECLTENNAFRDDNLII